MIVSIINGGPRTDGATAKVLKEISSYLESKGDVTIKYFDLSSYNMKFCKGCATCESTGRCVITDDGINAMLDEIRNSDGVVMGSPTYASFISGQLKTFFDRISVAPIDQSLLGKYGFSVCTYELADGKMAMKMIKYFLLVCGLMRKGEFLLKLPFDSDPFSSKRVRQKLNAKTEAYYKAIKLHARKSLYETLFSAALVHLVFKPLFMKNHEKYGWVLKMWKERKII